VKKVTHFLVLAILSFITGDLCAVIKPDFRVNPPDTVFIAQFTTDVAFQKNGSFVVVWEDRGWDHDNRQVYFQRYDSLGNPIGPITQVSNSGTGYYNQGCQIATDSTGAFAICYVSTEFVWVDPITGQDVFIFNVYVRLYSANGQPLTPSMKVDLDRPDTYENEVWYAERHPHVARHKNGKFVVVWEEETNSPNDSVHRKILCQFYDENGQRVGNNIMVNNPDSTEFPISTRYAVFARAAITDDEHVLICWEGLPSGQIQPYPLATLYRIGGENIRRVFSLLEFDFTNNRFGSTPDVEATPQNEFVVSFDFNDNVISYPNNAIGVRRVDTLGNFLGSVLICLDTVDIGDIWRMPRVNAGPDGYIVFWSDKRSGDRNLMAQSYDYSDKPIGKNYRINGAFGSLSSPPDIFIDERQGNRFYYDLDLNLRGNTVVAWCDYRNYVVTSADIYAKLLKFEEIGFYKSGDLN